MILLRPRRDVIPAHTEVQRQVQAHANAVLGKEIAIRCGLIEGRRRLQWLRDGKISVSIKTTFKLDEIQKVHRVYTSSERMGSIVIEVSP